MFKRSGRTHIIAEAGVNHNGSLTMAKQLVDVAAEAGADAVKFQTFKAASFVSSRAPKADYQKCVTDKGESQMEMLRKCELDEDAFKEIIEQCHKRGIEFLSTPFDFESIDLLVSKFGLSRIKLSSGEITNGPLLLKVAQTHKPLILSTGMSTLGEVELALGVLAFGYMQSSNLPSFEAFHEAYGSEKGQQSLREKVVLLHCTTAYPAPFSEVNLMAMDTLYSAFQLPVGLSDHTLGIAVAVAAVACGASIIEKHFTLDRSLPGPDHKSSLVPDELKAMVHSIREVESSLGNPYKVPARSELKNRIIVRKSLVAAKDIRKGEVFAAENLTFKRPGNGYSPMTYWSLLGHRAKKDYARDELVEP